MRELSLGAPGEQRGEARSLGGGEELLALETPGKEVSQIELSESKDVGGNSGAHSRPDLKNWHTSHSQGNSVEEELTPEMTGEDRCCHHHPPTSPYRVLAAQEGPEALQGARF